mgnify:CR=1 FL=1
MPVTYFVDATFVRVCSNPTAHSLDPVGTDSDPVAQSLDPVGMGSDPAAHSSDPVGTGSDPIAQFSNPVGTGSYPVAHSVSHVRTSPNLVSHSPAVVWSLPLKYVVFSNVFENKNADQLPEYWPYDCPIDLQEGSCPPFGPIYGLSEPELKDLRTYLNVNLTKGFIQPSKITNWSPNIIHEEE